MKKLITLLLTVVVSLGCVFGFTGCRRDDEEQFDDTKSHIYVGVFNAGYGVAWLNDLKTRFETYYEGVSFEKDKEGVQVHISDVTQGTEFINQIGNSSQEVIFTSNADYYAYVNDNKLLDITDAITTPLEINGETKSIEDKIPEAEKNFYKTKDNKYYAVTASGGNYGIMMNVDLFENKDLYFAKGGCPSEYLRTNENCDKALSFPEEVTSWDDSMYEFTGKGEKSAGPDGKYGTNDDGQPATYDEFIAFCDNCVDNGVQAFHWPGKYQSHISHAMLSMVADYEGSEQMMLNYTFNGVAKNLISVDEDGNVTKLPELKITNSNGYELGKQAGRYYVLDFIERLLANKSYYNENLSVYNSTHTHTDAQDDFVSGGLMDGKKEIALLWDGPWWYNEAQPAFNVLGEGVGEHCLAKNRKFQKMSYPKATNEKVGEEKISYLYSSPYICMANANVDSNKVDMIKKFIKFAFTNESNLKFTEITNTTRTHEYDIPTGYTDKLSYYAKTVLEDMLNSTVCFGASSNKMYVNKSFSLFNPEIYWSTLINGDEFYTPNQAFTHEGKTAIEYFNGLIKARDKAYWDRNYSDFYQD